ncbi:hypothetical protein MC885_007779, partial [Smutsia gigantea]
TFASHVFSPTHHTVITPEHVFVPEDALAAEKLTLPGGGADLVPEDEFGWVDREFPALRLASLSELRVAAAEGFKMDWHSLTKVLYDFTKILENGRVHGSPLQKLVISRFDDEQIWQQLELHNEPVLQYFQNAVSETIKDKDSLLPENDEQECEEDGSEMEADGPADLEQDLEEEKVSHLSVSDSKGDRRAKNSDKFDLRRSPVFSDEDSDLDFDISKLEQQSKVQNKVPGKPREKSIVDDKFFKLSEMETFLENIEKEEQKMRRRKKTLIFLKINLKYKDFFDPVESDEDLASVHGDELVSNEEEEEIAEEEESISETDEDNDLEGSEDSKQHKETLKRVTFALPVDEETEIMDILNVEKDSDEVKSSFEKRQEKNEKIASLEKELLEKKPWQLQGEGWDDVVRKEKPKEDAYEYKTCITLDHEKSKLSLAEIYEQEYIKLNQQKTAAEENPEHVEIQKMLDSLFLKLDAFSNFHFIPKPPVPEIKVVSHLPAITWRK